MSCSLPPRELAMKKTQNSNTKMEGKLKLTLKRYYHLSYKSLFHVSDIVPLYHWCCFRELAQISNVKRWDIPSPQHSKEICSNFITVRSLYGRNHLSPEISVRTNLQNKPGLLLWLVKRGTIIASWVPRFCLLAKNSQMHHIPILLQGRYFPLLTNQTCYAQYLAIQFARSLDMPSIKAPTLR